MSVPVFGPMGGLPQQPNQQQVHPTVPYGQNGQGQAVVIPPNQPMPSAGQQQQMMQQPGGYQQQPQSFQQQQPSNNYQQQQQPQQQQSTFPAGTQPPFQTQRPPQGVPQQQSNVFQIPDNAVLDGPTVPPELRGRTWGQIRGAYSTMAQEFFAQPGRIPAPRPNQLGAQQQQQQARPQQQTGQQQEREPTFWENPEAAINRAVERQLQPVVQRTTADGIKSAYEDARTSIQDFGVLEGDLMNVMKGAPDASMLTDPSFWRSTADLVRGRMMAEGRYNPQQAQQQQLQQQGGYPQQNQFQQQQQQPQQQRGPGVFQPAGAFFTENPTPTPGMQFNGQQMVRELTPEQRNIAQKMGMSDQEYRDWSVGFQQNTPARSW